MDFYNFMQILDEDEHRQVTLLRLVKTRTSALGRKQTSSIGQKRTFQAHAIAVNDENLSRRHLELVVNLKSNSTVENPMGFENFPRDLR